MEMPNMTSSDCRKSMLADRAKGVYACLADRHVGGTAIAVCCQCIVLFRLRVPQRFLCHNTGVAGVGLTDDNGHCDLLIVGKTWHDSVSY